MSRAEDERHPPYFITLESKDYCSKEERIHLLKMMRVKWAVDDIRTFISVMPDC